MLGFPQNPQQENWRLFYFCIFQKKITEIYFWFQILQFYTPTARQGGGRGPTARQGDGKDLYVNKNIFFCVEVLGGCLPPHRLAAGGLPPGRGAASSRPKYKTPPLPLYCDVNCDGTPVPLIAILICLLCLIAMIIFMIQYHIRYNERNINIMLNKIPHNILHIYIMCTTRYGEFLQVEPIRPLDSRKVQPRQQQWVLKAVGTSCKCDRPLHTSCNIFFSFQPRTRPFRSGYDVSTVGLCPASQLHQG